MDIEKSNNSSDKLLDLDRRINRYEREITYLQQKNESMNSQLKILLKEKEKYDDSVKDMKRELIEKKQTCQELEQKLEQSERDQKQLQETYRKTLNDILKNQKSEEACRLNNQIEKQKEQLEMYQDNILKLEREKENLNESLEILQQQIQKMKENESNLYQSSSVLLQSNAQTLSLASTLETNTSNLSTSSSAVQNLDFSLNAQISSYTLQISSLKNQLESARKDSDDNKANFLKLKNTMNEQVLKFQQQVTDKDAIILEKQGEIESLKNQIKALKEQVDQDNIDKHDLKQNYEQSLNKQKTEILQLQQQIEKLEKNNQQLLEEIQNMGQKNSILQDSVIPTEEDSIREITLKYNQIQKDYIQVSDKNKQLQAQIEYLKRDIKQKLPVLGLRKNEYQTMHTNYQNIKEKLALSIKNANQLQLEKSTLLEQIEKLSQQKSEKNKKVEAVEHDCYYLNFLLNKLKKVVVERNNLEGINLVHYNLEYIKQVGISESEKQEYELLRQQLKEKTIQQELEEENNEIQQLKSFVKADEYNKIIEKCKLKEEECFTLQNEIVEYKDKIEKLEQIDAIRYKILGEANSTISQFNSQVLNNELLQKERCKLNKVEEERDYYKKEFNKCQFELSRIKNEQEILKEMIEQVQVQANLYSSKYEQILKSQLKENTAFEQCRVESKRLKQQLLEVKIKNESLIGENNRLNSQIEFQQKQIKQETQNYIDALKKKSFFIERDQKSSLELKNLRTKITEQNKIITELREKNQLEIEVIQTRLNEQQISFQQSQVYQNILIENLKLLTQQSTNKTKTLNRIIQDQEKEIKQLKAKQQNISMLDENGDQIQDPTKDMILDENFVRLDTQFLKNLNKMEQIVSDQKEEHQKSIQQMQSILEELAEKCVVLSDKLKEAEKLNEDSNNRIKTLEEQHLVNIDKKEKEFQLLLEQKQKMYSDVQQRFEEYRKEQQKQQQDIITKMQQEQQIQSENNESSFKLKRLTDEKEELAQQLKEIKEYLGQLASEKLILESANRNEIEYYVNQLNKNQQQLLKVQEAVNQDAAMDIEEKDISEQKETQTNQKNTDPQDALLKKINDESMIYNFEQKINQLQKNEEGLRSENELLLQEKTKIEQELQLLKNSQIQETEVQPTENLAEIKKSHISEIQELQGQFEKEKQVLQKQIQHLSQFNKGISSEEAFNINLITQKDGFLELMEKLQKYIELQTSNIQNNEQIGSVNVDQQE
ncbi:hypothetical protein TTHERM_00502290 (macronuclear) [Tetrahymena thermophila SB210]|uniref:Uncharacterized protein n=1 Tax=Tetrahymena thermophila (strain SB210) TaxID=312017 RepID=I7LWK1_TETTS|nr:hypothetical protein TTHERM_00502290 [Tetrahymena thermophila SB210]EAS02038.2 hypothetical protein TTHERM_00502290 [Tetrahymena thermophila SB210]|eukprot:XP_001022283.2 hypothetical protein TTHERM_00502290 [Tetrahymena thermophila SB210]